MYAVKETVNSAEFEEQNRKNENAYQYDTTQADQDEKNTKIGTIIGLCCIDECCIGATHIFGLMCKHCQAIVKTNVWCQLCNHYSGNAQCNCGLTHCQQNDVKSLNTCCKLFDLKFNLKNTF